MIKQWPVATLACLGLGLTTPFCRSVSSGYVFKAWPHSFDTHTKLDKPICLPTIGTDCLSKARYKSRSLDETLSRGEGLT